MTSSSGTMRCKHCRYRLDGLADTRCPECGEAFDPDDPCNPPFLAWRELPVFMIAAVVSFAIPFVIRYRLLTPIDFGALTATPTTAEKVLEAAGQTFPYAVGPFVVLSIGYLVLRDLRRDLRAR